MKDVRGTGKSPKRDIRRTSRKLICLAVSALALAIVLSPILIYDDSSADTVNNNVDLELYDNSGTPIPRTSPLIENSMLSFSTITTPEGVVYELQDGTPIESTLAYFLIHIDGGSSGYGLFKVSVKIEGLEGTWMDHYGIRVSSSIDEQRENVVATADLSSSNSYEMLFQSSGVDKAFNMDVKYFISFSTLSGSHILDVEPGTVGQFTIIITAEPIAEYHNVEYFSDSKLEESRLLRDFDKIGPFPPVHSGGQDPIGWINYDGELVDEDTLVSELPTDMVIALYSWPVIIEKQTEYIDAEGNDVTEKLRKEIYEDGHYIEDTSKKVEDKDGNVKEETSHTEKDSDDNTREYDTQTDITKHDDGAETYNTSTETRVNGVVTETTNVRTEYDSEKTMVEEELVLRVLDPGTGEMDQYDVVTKLIDIKSAEKKYKVEATIEGMDLKDVDKVSEIIDDYFSKYDCEIASVGMDTDSGMTVSHELMGAFAAKNYRLFNRNGDLCVELDEKVVKWLHGTGSKVDLRINIATPDEMTEAQRKTVGNNYAISVTLMLDGQVVSVLQEGLAEITVKIDQSKSSVYYVDEGGSSEYIECSYDKDTQILTYKVDHFSIFMIVEEEDGHKDVLPFFYVALAELLLIPLGVFAYYRRIKRKGSM